MMEVRVAGEMGESKAEGSDVPFYLDDISSIESSSRRERKYSEEVILSLTHAVQRLADTLETKEAELETQAAELQTQAAELKMKDRAEVDLESRVLDLMIENAELKNQAQDTSSVQQQKDQLAPTITDNSSSIQREVTGSYLRDGKENDENGATENCVAVSKVKAPPGKPPLGRRSSGPSLSKLIPKLPTPKSGLGGRSLFTNQGKRLSWSRRSGVFPKLIPRHVSALPGGSSDEVSDLSSV